MTGESLALRAPRAVLHLAENLTLEASGAAAQRLAFLGASGSGKSYGCGRYVEQLSAAHVPVLIVDTVGIWPALRLAADGKKQGLPFTVIGGEHADVQLDLGTGDELARFLVQHDASAVIDLSDHEPTPERALFVAEFARALLVAVKGARRPRVIVFDEAQDLVPQSPGKGEETMVRAVSALVRKGRNHLCGTVLVTQRPQDVSKRAFDQVGNLFVGALFAKRARDAVKDWAGSKARALEVEQQIDDLPQLQPGDFFFWSPQWLKVYQRVRILPKWTYDGSSSTPIDAQLSAVLPVNVDALRKVLSPKVAVTLTAVSVPALGLNMVSAKDAEHNQSELLGRINELIDERNAARDAYADARDRLQTARSAVSALELGLIRVALELGDVVKTSAAMVEACKAIGFEVPPALPGVSSPTSRNPGPQRTVGSSRTASPRENGAAKGLPRESGQKAHSPGETSGSAGSYRDHILAAVARFEKVSRMQIAVVTVHNPTSSQFASTLGELVRSALIALRDGDYVATQLGTKQATTPRYLRGRAVLDAWLAHLTPYAGKIFSALVPERSSQTVELGRTNLAERAVVNPTSSQYATTLRRLRRVGLIVQDGKVYRLSPEARWAMNL